MALSSSVVPTTSAVAPSVTGIFNNPPAINGYANLGCYGSPSGYPTFSLATTNPLMTLEICVAACAGHAYAGTYLTSCYCADTLGDGASTKDQGRCNIACAGNKAETCGGLLPTGNFTAPVSNRVRRAAPPNQLVNLYANLALIPTGQPIPSPIVVGTTVTSMVTVVYTTICATNPALLTVTTFCTPAVITPGIAVVTTAVVPMTVCTSTCNACGPSGASTVTLTVPVAAATVVPTAQATAVASATVIATPLPSKVVTAAADAGVSSMLQACMGVLAGVMGLVALL